MKVFENGNDVLQPLLDAGGVVDVREAGMYILHKPLIIHSHTRFRLRQGVVLKAAPMSQCSLLENAALYGNGLDEDIEVIGGEWDGNCDEQGIDAVEYAKTRNDQPYSIHRFMGKMLRFAHVRNITFRDAILKDPVSYGLQMGDVEHFLISDLFFDYNCHYGTSDGVHINGPARDGRILRMSGITNDDLVSLTTTDENHAEITRGPISDVLIDGVHSENGYTGVRLLSCGEPLTDITVKNISGTYRVNGICVTHHNIHPGEPIWMDNIVIDGVYASRSPWGLTGECFTFWGADGFDTDAMVWVAKSVQIGSLTVRNVERQETTASRADTVLIDPEASIQRFTVQNLRHNLDTPVLVIRGDVAELIEK